MIFKHYALDLVDPRLAVSSWSLLADSLAYTPPDKLMSRMSEFAVYLGFVREVDRLKNLISRPIVGNVELELVGCWRNDKVQGVFMLHVRARLFNFVKVLITLQGPMCCMFQDGSMKLRNRGLRHVDTQGGGF